MFGGLLIIGKMFKKLVIFIAFLTLCCTIRSGFVDRAISDYFPLHNGDNWLYISDSGDTVEARVEGDTVWSDDSAVIYVIGSEVYCLFPSEYFVDQLYREEAFRGGDRIVLEERRGPYLKLPPVDGCEFSDTFCNTEVVVNDTFAYIHIINGTAIYVGDMCINGRSFEDVYRIVIRDQREVSGPFGTEEKFREEILFLAPQIGIVKKEVMSVENADTSRCILKLLESSLLEE